MTKRRMLIVCGLPGAGKTTLVRELSKSFSIPYFSRDIMKELLYEVFGGATLEDSTRYGTIATDLFFRFVREQLQNGGSDSIVEGVFNYSADCETFAKWAIEYDLECKVIVCQIDENLRKDRYVSRASSPERHAAHQECARLQEQSFEEITKPFDYSMMPGDKLFLTTNRPVRELVTEVGDWSGWS